MKEDLVNLPFFIEKGFYKKQCKVCGKTFWTLNPEQQTCGDQPCVDYEFVDNPLNPSAGDISTIRQQFLKFFEKNGHTIVKRYPVVARWRTDVYLVGASIYDFQPWVTEGIVDPPANPLTISQPSIRLTDVDNVGRSGRHLTGFEMMAHHAFNVRGAKIYWANETVEYAFRLLTEVYGVPENEISFKFDWWSGGGNAGEDYEVLVRGIEVATLVFMHYKVEDETLVEMPNRIVDTGYGLERIAWLMKGGATIYDVVFPEAVKTLREKAGVEQLPHHIAFALARKMGKIDYKEPEKAVKIKGDIARKVGITLEELNKLLAPHEAIWAIADHTRTILWIIGDGVVPSNVGAGYLVRLLIRRAARHLLRIGEPLPLTEIVALQAETWRKDFPEYYDILDDIVDIVDYEVKRYRDTLKRGRKQVAKVIARSKGKKITFEDLVKLYESHGVTPDIVVEEARKRGAEVEVPPDFYSKLAKGREKPLKQEKEEEFALKFAEKVKDLPETRKLYYENPYLFNFTAKVIKQVDGEYVVLDQTAFYAQGGGQPGDTGRIRWRGGECRVTWVGKVGGVILHKCEGQLPPEGEHVEGILEKDRRLALMRHHTSTHIILGAAKKVLGPHVWQAGAQKGVEQSRLDITHHKRITREEIAKIEELANKIVMENRKVNAFFMDRNEAEQRYGFALYQGGVVPEPVLRIVEVEGWDVEACGGTHVAKTGEIGLIKIVKVERIQDGVSRLIFKAGFPALKYVQEIEDVLRETSQILGTDIASIVAKTKELKEVELPQLRRKLAYYEGIVLQLKARELLSKAKPYRELKLVVAKVEGELANKARDLAITIAKIDPTALAVVMFEKDGKTYFSLKIGDKGLEQGLDASQLSRKLVKIAGGKGGGVKDLASGYFEREISTEELEKTLGAEFE